MRKNKKRVHAEYLDRILVQEFVPVNTKNLKLLPSCPCCNILG